MTSVLMAETSWGKWMHGEIRRLGPSPLQHQRRCVVKGVKGRHILLIPAQIPQGASPADHLRRPVEDDGGIFLPALLGRRRKALSQGPQGFRAQTQPLPQPFGFSGGLSPRDNGFPHKEGAVMAQNGGQGGAGRHPQQAGAIDSHLQRVGQLHRQCSPCRRPWPEPALHKPLGISKGGQHGVNQHQDSAAAQRRAEWEEGQASRRAAKQRSHRIFPGLASGREPRRQRRASFQAAPGGKESRRAVPGQPEQFSGIKPFQGNIGDFHSLSPST